MRLFFILIQSLRSSVVCRLGFVVGHLHPTPGRSLQVREDASLRWLTGSVTLVSGLRLDAICPVGTVC